MISVGRKFDVNRRLSRRLAERPGAVLLEVVLAMALLALAAGAISSSVRSSLRALDHLQVEARAMDLAVSKLSELQMGVIDVGDTPVNEYEDERLNDWTWRMTARPVDTVGDIPASQLAEVIITHAPSGKSWKLYWLSPPSEEAYGGMAFSGGSTGASP